MGNFVYKEYTPEESEIYEAALMQIKKSVKDGLPFHDACTAVCIEDTELKSFIVSDALKILIAELHFVGNLPLDKVGELLCLTRTEIGTAVKEMLEDVGISSAEMFKKLNPDSPIGNA